MLGIEKSKTSPNDFFRDESEPRPPPRFPALPIFDMETPKPTVPDVSLFFPSPIMVGNGNSSNHNSFGLGLGSGPYGSTPTSASGLSRNNSQQMSILPKGQTPETPKECSYGHGYGTMNSRMISAATYSGQNSHPSSNSHLHSNSLSPHTSTPTIAAPPPSLTSPSLDNSLLQQLVEMVKKQSTAVTVAPPPSPAVDNTLIHQLIGMVKSQSMAIEKLQEQLDTLTAITATAQSQSRRNSSSGSRCSTPTKKIFVSKEVQVNLQQLPLPESRKQSPRQVFTKVPTANFGCQTEKEKEPRDRENERSIMSMSVESTSGDVSRFLRDVSLRLPQIEENTVYSVDTSAIRHIDMPEYDSDEEEEVEADGVIQGDMNLNSDNNGNGPGIFAFASSSEDENGNGLGERIVKPTEMFYHRNALENRSRYAQNSDDTPKPERKRSVPVEIKGLDNSMVEDRGRPPRPRQATATTSRDRSSSTDSTLYGLSSKHLSFSTKQYLQRYGLVHSGGTGQPAPSPKFLFGENGNDNGNCIGSPSREVLSSPNTDRILDITAIKNQPKLA